MLRAGASAARVALRVGAHRMPPSFAAPTAQVALVSRWSAHSSGLSRNFTGAAIKKLMAEGKFVLPRNPLTDPSGKQPTSRHAMRNSPLPRGSREACAWASPCLRSFAPREPGLKSSACMSASELGVFSYDVPPLPGE